MRSRWRGFRSSARRRQTSRRSARGVNTELIPSKFTPRRMNGNTVVLSSALPAIPMLAMFPQNLVVRVSHASRSPPTLSIAPAHCASSRGRDPGLTASRSRMRLAPSARRYSSADVLAGHRNDPIAAAGEHVDGETADAAARAGDYDFTVIRPLAVLLHAMNRQRRREARRAERHALELVESGRNGNDPVALAVAHIRRTRRHASQTVRSR